MKPPQRLTQKAILRYALQGALFAVAASTGVVIFYSAPETLEHLDDFNWWINGLLFGLIVSAWLLNGSRVYLLSRSLGYTLTYRQSLSVSLSSEFGIAATPAGMGGAAIRLSLLRRAGISWAHGTTMLAVDVVLDSIFFLLLVPFAAYSILNNPKIRQTVSKIPPGGTLGLLLSLAVAGILLGWAVRSRWFRRWIHTQCLRPGWRDYRLPARFRLLRWKVAHGWHQMKEGFRHLLGLKRGAVLLTFAVASLQWTCRYSVLPILFYALSFPTDPVLLFLLQGFLFTASLFFVLPGGGGGVEVATAIILRQIIKPSVVGVVVLLWRFFTYHLYLIGGGCMFFWTCARLPHVFPASPTAKEEVEIAFDDAPNPDSPPVCGGPGI